MSYMEAFGWDDALVEQHQQYKDVQNEKERARTRYENQLLWTKCRLFWALYGQWIHRSLPMWVMAWKEHTELLELVEAWIGLAQEEFKLRLEFLRQHKGAYPAVLSSSRPYQDQLRRLNHLRVEISFTQERAISHLLYSDLTYYGTEEATLFPRSRMADVPPLNRPQRSTFEHWPYQNVGPYLQVVLGPNGVVVVSRVDRQHRSDPT